MPIEKQDIEFIEQHIEEHIRKNLPVWLGEMSFAKPPQVYEIELRERMIRVEEELKNQRELMMQFMQQVDKRFEEMRIDMDKRFEQVDKRFEQVDKRFEEMRIDMDKRFEQVDKRFEQVDKRFEMMDKRFEEMNNRLDRFMRWSLTLTISVGSIIIAAIKLLP